MPSTKRPALVVNPGPGKLPAGVATASSFTFSPGGGGGAALAAHINDPVDAHMASAIGVNPYYPNPIVPMLTSVGGPYEGESVLDALYTLMALIPPKPDKLGFDTGVPNSGIPNWGNLNVKNTGGWTNTGPNVQFSHYLVPSTTIDYQATGMIYPADRGVVALYYSTTGSYLDGASTLVGALWLGANPAPPGIASAAYDQALQLGQQLDYVASLSTPEDIISLTWRLPYLADYSGFPGAPYSVFPLNFPTYQLATYTFDPITVGPADAGSWVMVHWRETYVTALADIQGAALIPANFVDANCFSATLDTSPDFDNGDVENVNRHWVYQDANWSLGPVGSVFTSVENGVPTTFLLSGVAHYDNGATPLTWNVDVQATNLFDDSYVTGTLASPPDLPVGFESVFAPMEVLFRDFGGADVPIPYFGLQDASLPPGTNYDVSVPPGLTDVAQYLNTTLAIGAPNAETPKGGGGVLRMQLSTPFTTSMYLDLTKYMFNSYPQSGPTTSSDAVSEPFTDEKYRFLSNYNGNDPTKPLDPSGDPDDFNSAAVFLTDGPDLQVVGHDLVYPNQNYTSGYKPLGQPNYAAVLASDSGAVLRRYVRAFDTGIPRNTGKLRVQGVTFTNLETTAPFDGNEQTGHAGGCIVQVKVPGKTGWLDVGRPKGDPGVGTLDFYGCRTAVTGSGFDFTYTFDTTQYTQDNGSGEFLLFIRVILIKNGIGQTLEIADIEWSVA